MDNIILTHFTKLEPHSPGTRKCKWHYTTPIVMSPGRPDSHFQSYRQLSGSYPHFVLLLCHTPPPLSGIIFLLPRARSTTTALRKKQGPLVAATMAPHAAKCPMWATAALSSRTGKGYKNPRCSSVLSRSASPLSITEKGPQVALPGSGALAPIPAVAGRQVPQPRLPAWSKRRRPRRLMRRPSPVPKSCHETSNATL
ncbi:hypothetical protein BC628DRAFT_144787 [Trametes gibbosa]|nr:hypothetical protein BC628DRAFT_144787 [Trametes gibbosa]